MTAPSPGDASPPAQRSPVRTAATLGILTGVALAAAETVRNWGDREPWPYPAIDYIAAALLIAAAVAARRTPRHAPTLCAATGGLCILALSSLIGNIDHWHGDNYGPIPQKPYTIMVGIALAWSMTLAAITIRATHTR